MNFDLFIGLGIGTCIGITLSFVSFVVAAKDIWGRE